MRRINNTCPNGNYIGACVGASIRLESVPTSCAVNGFVVGFQATAACHIRSSNAHRFCNAVPKILQDVVKALEQEPVPEDFHTERAKKDLLRMLTVLIGEFLIGGENFDTVLVGELRPILSTASPDPCDRQRVTVGYDDL